MLPLCSPITIFKWIQISTYPPKDSAYVLNESKKLYPQQTQGHSQGTIQVSSASSPESAILKKHAWSTICFIHTPCWKHFFSNDYTRLANECDAAFLSNDKEIKKNFGTFASETCWKQNSNNSCTIKLANTHTFTHKNSTIIFFCKIKAPEWGRVLILHLSPYRRF